MSTTSTSYSLRLASRDRVAGDLDRISDAVARLRRVDRDAGLLADDLELGDGVGALEVGRDQHRRAALLLEPAAELAGQRGLTRTLQTGEHDHGRRVLGELDPSRLATEDRDEFLVDDLDDLLGRVERLADLGAGGPLPDPVDELTDSRQRDVGLEQRDPDLTTRRVDVGLGEPALATKVLERGGKPVLKSVEHR